jgi:uncharacterized protein YhbP (UPF0306 family)
VPIRQSRRPVAVARLAPLARELLEASRLCAIATVGPRGRAHVNTAYFAWGPRFEFVWLSEPGAAHSRNIRANGSAAVAVYESGQSWGSPDRGIQLLGSARELGRSAVPAAASLYSERFPAYWEAELGAYRFYRFRPRRLKLFDERLLGAGVFVTAGVGAGRLRWERTDVYDPSAA